MNYKVLDTIDIDHSFIGMPLVRIKIMARYELQAEVLKHRSELFTPVTDSGIRNLYIERYLKYQSNVSKGVFPKVEH